MNKLKLPAALLILCLAFTACGPTGKNRVSEKESGSESIEASAADDASGLMEESGEKQVPSSDPEESIDDFPLPEPVPTDPEQVLDEPSPPPPLQSEPPVEKLADPVPAPRAAPPASSVAEDAPPPAASSAAPVQDDIRQIEEELLRLINGERTQNGLESLGMVESMQFAARMRAEESLLSLSHSRPSGSPYYTAFEEADFDYAGKWHGENLAMLSVDPASYSTSAVAAALFDEWLKSPGHHQNIISENFIQTGIGVYVEKTETTVTIGSAQLFASL